jgi:DNA polymerase (family 10)
MASKKVKRSRGEVEPWVDVVTTALKHAGVKHKVCGSVRRGKDVVGDVDIVVGSLVCTDKALQKLENGAGGFIKRMTTKDPAEAKGGAYLINNIQFDFRIANDGEWGAMILFLTGSWKFNVAMRIVAKNQGYKLNQYGLWHGDDCIAGKEEKQIFDALGIEWYHPTQRDIRTYSLKRKE